MKRSAQVVLALCIVACGQPPVEEGPLAMERIATIAGPEGEDGFQSFALVSPVLHDGRRLAFMSDVQNELPWILDHEGRATRQLGAIGDGPGEFRWVRGGILGEGDSVLIFDQLKIHLFSPDLEYVRTFPSPGYSAWLPTMLTGGRIAVASTSRRSPAVTVISQRDGSTLWTIPADSFGLREFPDMRLTAADPDGSLWVVTIFRRLVLQHYTADGTLLGTLTPNLPWFEPYARYQGPSKAAPSSPYIRGVWIDSLHRAWVVAQVPDPEWAAAEGEVQRGEGGSEYFKPKDGNAVRDGLIDVIDLRTAMSLGSARLDSMIIGPFEPGTIARPTVTEDGWNQLTLFRVTPRF